MKNLYSFFSVITVLSLLMTPLTTSTVSLYAQETGEPDLEIVEVIVEDDSETVGDAEVKESEEPEELEFEGADAVIGEQVLGIQASGAEVLAQNISNSEENLPEVIDICTADFSGNKIINQADVDHVTAHWNETCSSGNNWCEGADINKDEFVGIEDLNLLLSDFGRVCVDEIITCAPDVSGNGAVDQADVDLVTDHWNETCSSGNNWCEGADINRDEFVGIEDLNIVLSDFGQVCVEETTNQTIEVCKVVVDPDGNIVNGSEKDAEFSILVEGPDGFSETVTFGTPLNLTDDLLDNNGYELDAQCVTLSNLEKGKYTYEAEDIDGEGWLVPLYNDFFSENPDSLENFYELTVDGVSGDNDNADGVINLGEDSKRTLAIVNKYEREETQNQCEIGVELLENGSFESPEVEDLALWDIFDSGAASLGWFVEWVRIGGAEPEVASIELHRGVNGWSSSDGLQHAELDGDWQGPGGGSGEDASTAIYQDVATITGEFYDLSFAFSPRPSTSASENILEVLWEGFVVATIGPDAGSGDVDWGVHNMQLEATQDGSRLEFRDAGNGNSVGTLLDNVSLVCGEEDEPEESIDQVPIVNLDADHLNIIGNVTGGFFSRGLVAGASEGQVLGVTCGIYLNDFLHINSPNNDKMEMVKLQAFLKQFINPDLEVTGTFDQATFDAVWEFQLQYADQIIGPWANVGLLNESQATGYVYKTTQRQINLLVCPLLTLPVPGDLAPDLDVTDNS